MPITNFPTFQRTEDTDLRLLKLEGAANSIHEETASLSAASANASVAISRAERGLQLPFSPQSVNAPTVSISTSTFAASNAAFLGWDRVNGRVSPLYTFSSMIPQQGGPAASNYDWVRNAILPNTTLGFGGATAEFATDVNNITIPFAPNHGGSIRIFVDGVERASVGSGITGTAQAGAAATITLAAASSAVNGFYNGQWVYIISGTGLNQFRQISGYVGSTKVATVSLAWLTNPDSTSVYNVSPLRSTFCNANGAGNAYINFDWGGEATMRVYRCEFASAQFRGVLLPSAQSLLMSVPKPTGTRCLWFGDSFSGGTGSAAVPFAIPSVCCNLMGWELFNLSIGGTGYLNPGTGSMTIAERLNPQNTFYFNGFSGTAGTFTVSWNGLTTGAIAYDATAAATQTAVDTAFGAGVFRVVGGGVTAIIHLWFVGIGTGANAALPLTINTSGITGTVTLTRYVDEVFANVPRDGSGNALAFVIVIAAGHNDTTATSAAYTDAALESAVTTTLQRLKTAYPTATILIVGNMFTRTAGAEVLAANAAQLAAVTATLPMINNKIPFVDSQLPIAWVTGTGSIIAPAGTTPTAGSVSADSINGSDAVHPSISGHQFFGVRIAENFAEILWSQ